MHQEIEQEINHEIAKGQEYASLAKRGVEDGIKSLGRVASGFVSSISYYQDQEGRLYRVITPAPLQVLLFKRVPRIELISERRI